jgi:hypothetical protein
MGRRLRRRAARLAQIEAAHKDPMTYSHAGGTSLETMAPEPRDHLNHPVHM